MDTTMAANSHAPGIDTELWQRGPGESGRAYAMLWLYMSMGPRRTLAAVAASQGLSPGWLRKLSRKRSWPARTAAYDQWVLATEAAENRLARIDMSRRQAALGAAMQSRANEGLQGLDASSMTAFEVAALAKTGTTIERLARGESTENRAVQGGIVIQWAGPRPKWAPLGPPPGEPVGVTGAAVVLDATEDE